MLLYDDNIEEAFFHTFDYLFLCAQNGITINSQNFHFAKPEVEFIGYKIGLVEYNPSDNMTSAIKNFKMPQHPTITDIRSWFGLSRFLESSQAMAPFH